MTKHLLLIILLFAYCTSDTVAQDFIIKSEIKDRGKTNKTHTLLNYDSTGYYALRFNKQLTYAELEHYDLNLQFKKTFVVTKKHRKYIGVVNIAQKMYLLYFSYIKNKRENTHEKVSLYARQITSDSFALSGDSIELIKPFRMTSNYYRGNFAISPDYSKILVYDFEEEGDIDDVKGLTNKIRLRVFDSSFKKLWSRTVNLSPDGGAKRKVSIKKLRINNRGDVAILSDIFRNHRTYNSRNVTADPTLFFVGKEKKNYSLFKPNLGEYFFNQINFTFDTKGNILWFGFYSKQKYYQQKGVFFIKINRDRSKVLVKKQHELSPELISKLLNKKKVRAKSEARSYKLKHWRLMQDGGIVMSAEQEPNTSYNFRSNDIVAIRFSSEGEITWAKHLFKYGNQPRNQKVFLSHYMYTAKNNIYFLFNKGLYSDGYATIARIDSTGSIENRKFYNYQNQQELVCPLLSYQLKTPQIFICLQDRYFSNYRFAILDFEKLFLKK
jgi:hypothetical protein